MGKWWDLDPWEKASIASEMEREHARKGHNIVSLSAARYRRNWNRDLHLLSGGDDDSAA